MAGELSENDSKKDVKQEIREEQQKVMMDLALKTDSFLEKLKAETKKTEFKCSIK